MKHGSLWNKARELLNRFAHAKSGNVAVIFTVAVIPILGLAGAAIDFTRANSARTAMQAALDTTALMISKDVAGLTNEQISARAQQYFNALYHRTDTAPVHLDINYTGASSIELKGSTTMETLLLKVVGPKTLDVGTASTAKWGNTRLRVALVLDVTGSMGENNNEKMTALKTATKNLLGQLKAAAAHDGDVYVSIIPFNKAVNIGASNFNASWIDWTEWEKDESNSRCSDNTSTTKAKCLSKGKIWSLKSHSTFNGCVMDRGPDSLHESSLTTTGRDFDQTIDPPILTPIVKIESFVPAETSSFTPCPPQMMQLNFDWTAMNTYVDNLVPSGQTNQPIGLVWGWQSLVGGVGLPLPSGGTLLPAPALDPAFQYQQVIILLSDGLNSNDRWYPPVNQEPRVDLRMLNSSGGGTCKNVKDANFTLYTIHVETTPGAPESQLLRNCASEGHFFMLRSGAEIITTFQAIGTELSKLRVAK